MDIRDHRLIKQTASARLCEASYNPRRLVLIHTGITFGLSLLATAIHFVVNKQIAGTGGLSGLGMRSILTTVQTVLQYAVTILMPFWQIGFTAAMLATARGQSFTPQHILTKGFRRFSGVLGLELFRLALVFLISIACIYLCCSIFVMTPLAAPFMQILAPALQDSTMLAGGQIYLDDATLAAATDALFPLLIMAGVLVLVLLIPVSYRLRLAEFILMDETRCGGTRAALTSAKRMRRNCFALFRLDLSFWWFHLLLTATTFVGYLDLLLPALGISLPLNGDVAYFGFYILHMLLQLGLFVWAKPHLVCSQAVFYDNLTPAEPKPQPKPQNLPWDYQS